MSIRTALMEMAKPKTERAEWVPESIIDDDVSHFMGAAAAAKKSGKSHFDFGGKKYKVTMKHDAAKKIGESACACGENHECDCEVSEAKVDELSKKTYQSYFKKADSSQRDAERKLKDVRSKRDIFAKPGGQEKKLNNTIKKRNRGMDDARDRIANKESVEEAKVDELSTKTMNSYVKKASKQRDKAGDSYSNAARRRHDFAPDTPAMAKNAKKFIKRDSGVDMAQKKLAAKESVEEAAGTAQHGPTKATSDTFDKQMNNGEGSIPMGKKKDFVNMHNMEVALDAEEIYKKNKYEALSKTPARPGDQTAGDTKPVNPIPANPIDGMRAALAKMKLSGE